MESILLTKENGIATITLNRPKVFNSFDKTMRVSMIAALSDCADDPSVRCVVITGAGRAFCAGQDLAEISDAETSPSFTELLDEGYNRIALIIRQLEKPVVAAVNGVAAGAGASLALACDIVVAHEHASFIQSFSKIGLIPDTGGTFTLPRLIGTARATALMFLGEKVSAKEAENLGMIYRCYDEDLYLGNVQILAQTLAQMPTRGLALTKKALNASQNNSLEQQLALETQLQGQAAQTADYTEGVNAFLEKRPATFVGK
jgi:2-(1,2-epoxy-1,2-dihydrophenyl)acetyl-CoA isomerase